MTHDQTVYLPLCRRYLGVIVDTLDVHVRGDQGPSLRSVLWALALRSDGECEVVGAWPANGGSAQPVPRLFAELKDRGVEAIRVVMCSVPALIDAEARAAYPQAAVLPSLAALLENSVRAVAPSKRRRVGCALRRLTAAQSLDSATEVLDRLAGSSLGHGTPALVQRWRGALAQSAPWFALGARHRRVLMLGDDLVRVTSARVRRGLARQGGLPGPDRVSSRLGLALSRIGPTLVQYKAVPAPGASAPVRPPAAGRLAARP